MRPIQRRQEAAASIRTSQHPCKSRQASPTASRVHSIFLHLTFACVLPLIGVVIACVDLKKKGLLTDWLGTCCCFLLQMVQQRSCHLKRKKSGRKISNARKPTGRDRRCDYPSLGFLQFCSQITVHRCHTSGEESLANMIFCSIVSRACRSIACNVSTLYPASSFCSGGGHMLGSTHHCVGIVAACDLHKLQMSSSHDFQITLQMPGALCYWQPQE